MLKGHLHSVESLGTVDGPGLRYILFTQGCLLRCLYCHNPDTWEINRPSREVTVDEMVDEILPFKPYFDASGGGVTVSGGEPLLQAPFLTELFKALKARGIHTCIDTSLGCANDSVAFTHHFEALMEQTDLCLVDIKHIDFDKHLELTGKPNTHILKFIKRLDELKQPIWIRHVLVPGYTDDPEDLKRLGAFINELDNVEKFEILPYHQLGVHKWKSLGQTYHLEDVEPPDEEAVARAYELVNFKGLVPAS
ncbi:pyruvate formate-lyase-activating protein [Staphylococcus massiliensis]|uniref:Pyruvate formate-lyase-activating enzyme n=1 Tax=Staphylococcus massiliensis S46 TaxID=1229783 RepID=K9B5P9_9STAP|nr:pyruvate formate-lyase-activating protein [Staphylococcus massiliensis]EKU50162.1 formate acetyltransferase activating enzyme [Staphylococcus massiliensis S46]MCG3402125.1 pyruvate formate lyase-activating protein [Staphylococcus massiliensis]MCG3413306.1 pyruvate formate lyase-activating protein [Staphylococcus massiliensis]POA00856.1 pyruvate formate lyase-activating protein [Staphylococcus massiliensis CCUG 55927]